MKLAGKVAIVTGSGGGIGEAIAIKFAGEGAAVTVNDIDSAMAKKVADKINSQGGKAIAIKADVSKRADVEDMVRQTIQAFKAIHILVNNAGTIRHGTLLKLTDEDWDFTFQVDLKGVLYCTQAVFPHMMNQRYGKIINISSVAALGFGRPYQCAYQAAKAGVVALTKNTAREGGPYGINVNSIAPGLTITPLLESSHKTKEEVEAFIAERVKVAALGRAGRPEEQANLALFLASDDSSFITGQIIRCDGGRMDGM